MRTSNFCLAIVLPMILSACAGSSNMSDGYLAGFYKIAAQSNAAKSTNFFINGNQIPLETCDRHECIARGGFVASITTPGMILGDRGSVTEAEIGGIEIVRSDSDLDWRLLGGWMDHSAFFVIKAISRADSSTFLVYPLAMGRLYSVNNAALPAAGSASYEGAMAGTNIMTADRYAGRSSMTASFGESPTIDIHFTGIMNLNTGDTHSDISYLGASITDRKGIIGAPAYRNYVNGEFAGPDNEEVFGVFEHEDLIGAFGARRTE